MAWRVTVSWNGASATFGRSHCANPHPFSLETRPDRRTTQAISGVDDMYMLLDGNVGSLGRVLSC